MAIALVAVALVAAVVVEEAAAALVAVVVEAAAVAEEVAAAVAGAVAAEAAQVGLLVNLAERVRQSGAERRRRHQQPAAPASLRIPQSPCGARDVRPLTVCAFSAPLADSHENP
jgi:hypothetical protein